MNLIAFEVMHKLKPLLWILGVTLITSCSNSNVQIERGRFQVTPSPLINGDMHSISETHSYYKAGSNVGMNKTLNLQTQHNQEITPSFSSNNDDEYALPASNSNIQYRYIGTMPIFAYGKKWFDNSILKSIEFGGLPYPNAVGRIGINMKYFEIGVGGSIGFTANQVSYSGVGVWDVNQFSGSWVEKENLDEKNIWAWHAPYSVGVYSGIHFNKIGISGSVKYIDPWRIFNSLPSSLNNSPSFDPTIEFPGLIDMGVDFGYQYSNKIQFVSGIKKTIDVDNYSYNISGQAYLEITK